LRAAFAIQAVAGVVVNVAIGYAHAIGVDVIYALGIFILN
jgi:hypothetical protein